MPIIPALRRLKQGSPKFEASLGFTAIPCLKEKENKRAGM
jgi:hypothetical protein